MLIVIPHSKLPNHSILLLEIFLFTFTACLLAVPSNEHHDGDAGSDERSTRASGKLVREPK